MPTIIKHTRSDYMNNRIREFNTFLVDSIKTREDYVKAYNNLGYYDICECTRNALDELVAPINRQVRPNSGNPGQLECAACHELAFPFLAIYSCDYCGEPTLSDTYPVYIADDFSCSECY